MKIKLGERIVYWQERERERKTWNEIKKCMEMGGRRRAELCATVSAENIILKWLQGLVSLGKTMAHYCGKWIESISETVSCVRVRFRCLSSTLRALVSFLISLFLVAAFFLPLFPFLSLFGFSIFSLSVVLNDTETVWMLVVCSVETVFVPSACVRATFWCYSLVSQISLPFLFLSSLTWSSLWYFSCVSLSQCLLVFVGFNSYFLSNARKITFLICVCISPKESISAFFHLRAQKHIHTHTYTHALGKYHQLLIGSIKL